MAPKKAPYHLVIELSRGGDQPLQMVVSLPGRDGTLRYTWPEPPSWEDVQAKLLELTSEFLWLSGGLQERLRLR